MNDTTIFEATEPRREHLEAINSLLPQLSQTASAMSIDDLEAITASPQSHLFLLNADGATVGMCVLAVYATPTGRKAWIEDLVIDSRARGQHLGRKLLSHVVEKARCYAPCTLMLTSRPSRVAANRMYQAAGFERKETNVYRMRIIG